MRTGLSYVSFFNPNPNVITFFFFYRFPLFSSRSNTSLSVVKKRQKEKQLIYHNKVFTKVSSVFLRIAWVNSIVIALLII